MAVALLGTPGSNTPGVVSLDTGVAYTAFTYTVSAGSDRLLLLFICSGDSDLATAAPTAVTYGGQAMTQVTGYQKVSSTWCLVDAWYLKETEIAAAGSTTFSITYANIGDGLITHAIVGAAAFSGVDQTTPLGTAVSATGSSTAPDTGSITCPANGLVVGSVCTDDDNAFAEASTLLFEVEGVGADTGGGAQYRSTTGSLAWTTDAQQWAAAGIPVNAATGGGGGSTAVIGFNVVGMRPNAFAPGLAR